MVPPGPRGTAGLVRAAPRGPSIECPRAAVNRVAVRYVSVADLFQRARPVTERGREGGTVRKTSMPRSLRWGTLAAFTVAAVATVTAAAVAMPAGAASSPGNVTTFHQTNLVSNLSNVGAQVVDPGLQNAWGLAMSATSPLWVSDNNSGLATIYSIPAGGTSVTTAGLTVTVQGGRASTSDGSSPTGQVFNPTTGF